MRVKALLVDYDGTIAPLGVPRAESRIIQGVERELRKIVKSTPVCVVTAKDFDFTHRRCGFATGWACASGLDIRMADGRSSVARRLRNLAEVLDIAKAAERDGTQTELKVGPAGELLGVSIDWTGTPYLGARVARKLRPLAKKYSVSLDRHSTFADVYAAPPDKGKATIAVKKLLKVESNVMFIGDSRFDNPAFQEAEMAIGVDHGQPTSGLRCDYIVEQRRLAGFLRSLHGRGMDFTPSLPWVRRKEAA